MKKNNLNKVTDNSKPWQSILSELLKDNVRNVMITLITLIVGTVGFVATPLKEIVFHWIWEEKVRIIIVPSSEHVCEGDKLYLEITILPESNVGMSSGLIEVTSDDKLKLIEGNRTIQTDESNKALTLANNKRLVYVATDSGVAKVNVNLKTKYGSYKESRIIHIDNIKDRKIPSEGNFSGKWKTNIGFEYGNMELIEKSGDVTGRYYLKNGEQGILSGVRDGTTFYVELIRGTSSLTKWHIEATWKRSGNYIEIVGNSTLLVIKNDEWKKTQAPVKFYAAASVY